MKIDEHGQPQNFFFNYTRRAKRSMDELLGLCKMAVADGKLVDEEFSFLRNWLSANVELADSWPLNILNSRIDEMLSDGVFSDDERNDLLSLLEEIAGKQSFSEEIANFTTSLPLEIPEPQIIFPERSFAFTGRFAFGTRKACSLAVERRAGIIHPRPTKKTGYLVIGTMGSRDWAHSSWGRKIEHAVDIREKYGAPLIVAEESWVAALEKAPVWE